MRFKASDDPFTLLVDNGSLRPASVLKLRELAEGLSAKLGSKVYPVSFAHADRILPDLINQRRADVLEPFIEEAHRCGIRHFRLLPLLIAPSAAIGGNIREIIEGLQTRLPGLKLEWLPGLFDEQRPDNLQLARLLADQVRETIKEQKLTKPPVVVLDHGSPRVQAAAVRNWVAGQLSVLLEGEVGVVAAASMERREGEQYAFNDPLLETILMEAPFCKGPVVLAQLFFLPGRHAGEDGDIAEICRSAEAKFADLKVHRTALLGEHPALVEALAGRSG